MRPIVTDGVAWSVGLSVYRNREPCENGWTDRDAVWIVGSRGPTESCIKLGLDPSWTWISRLSLEDKSCSLDILKALNTGESADCSLHPYLYIIPPSTFPFLWPPCVADADIIFLPCGFCYLLFFPRLISVVAEWMSTVLPHMMWPRCEFRMQVWNVLQAARWKYRTQKWRKKSPSAHYRTTSSGWIFATKAYISTIGKKTSWAAISPPHVLTIW